MPPGEAPERIDLVRVLRADPSAAATVWLRGPEVAARTDAADLAEPHGAVPRVQLAPGGADPAARGARTSSGQLCLRLSIDPQRHPPAGPPAR